jgi:rare lipoprotein A
MSLKGNNEKLMPSVNIKKKTLPLFSLLSFILILTACSNSRYQHKHDSIPTRFPNNAELKDAIPRAEAKSRGGNKDYQVFGKSYQVLDSAKNFEQTGQASWYGNKFHGHLTSNGEIYDMYAMSAAHKNLPLPTYLKVTNLANNKSVVVRVNDRGPFHQSRIIDLSYSAAYKLDMLKQGTAQVKISAITNFDSTITKPQHQKEAIKQQSIETSTLKATAVSMPKKSTSKPTKTLATPYIQVFATSKKALAENTTKKQKKKYKQACHYYLHQGVYRIQIGPIADITSLNQLLASLKSNGYPNAFPKSNR